VRPTYPSSFPGQFAVFAHRCEGNDNNGAMLAVGQVHRDGTVEEIMHPASNPGLVCAEDDESGVHRVRQVTERARRVSGQGTQPVCHVHLRECSGNVSGQFRVELFLPQLGEVWVEGKRHDGAVRVLLDRVTSQINGGRSHPRSVASAHACRRTVSGWPGSTATTMTSADLGDPVSLMK
jgi:hypothetical protein